MSIFVWTEDMDGDPAKPGVFTFTAGMFKNQLVKQLGSNHGFMHFSDLEGTYIGYCGIQYFEANTTNNDIVIACKHTVNNPKESE